MSQSETYDLFIFTSNSIEYYNILDKRAIYICYNSRLWLLDFIT